MKQNCLSVFIRGQCFFGVKHVGASDYVELHARSAFSFLEGACIPEDFVGACASLDMPAMALLDRNGVYGSPRFHMAAKKAGYSYTDLIERIVELARARSM